VDSFLRFPEGSNAVVTGAGSGIGRATAKMCAAAGLGVGLWDIAFESVETLAKELVSDGARAVAVRADVTKRAEVEAAFQTTVDALGRIGFLVNNAGPANTTATPYNEGLVAAAGSMATVADAWLSLEHEEGDAVVNLASVAGTFTGVGSEPCTRRRRPPSRDGRNTLRCSAHAAYGRMRWHRGSPGPHGTRSSSKARVQASSSGTARAGRRARGDRRRRLLSPVACCQLRQRHRAAVDGGSLVQI